MARPRWRRERLELPDGDFLDIDQLDSPRASVQLLLLHGLQGNSDSPYMRGVANAALKAGLAVTALNFRGCSGEPNRLARSYHSGDTADFLHVAALLRARQPGRSLYATGFSLGGNALLKAMGELGAATPFDGAISVCAPLDLAKCGTYLDDVAWPVYRQTLVRSLRNNVAAKRTLLQGVIDMKRALSSRTFREFDDAVTAPLHGFAGVDDYYARSSARRYLGGVQKPTVILHAQDDPFMPMTVVPEASELSSSVQLIVSPQGGHVGFVGRAEGGSGGWWLDEWVVKTVLGMEEARTR